MVYQNHDSSFEHGASLKYGDVDCARSGIGSMGQAGDVWIVVIPEMTEQVIQISYSRHTLPEDKAQWIARSFQTVMAKMRVELEQPLHRIIQSMEAAPAIAAPTVSTGKPSQRAISSPSNGLEASSHPSSAYTRTLVAQAWNEVGLAAPSSSAASDGHKPTKPEDGDDSMFSGGADLVTTMLLARCYQRNGYSVSMQDLINHPTQEEQSRLLEARKGSGR
ncbi:MAG: hypothetical protein Q9186_006871 [Xanthomendoza sp. 1 TL-2023]